MNQPDKIVLDEFRKGNRKALDRIYGYYRHPILKFIASIIKDRQEAESIYHEVFLKILRKKEDIKPELNFNSYIFRAVRNEVFDYLKEVKKSHVLKEKFWKRIQGYREEEEEKENRESSLSRMEAIVSSLAPKRRRILEMNYFEKKSYKEIAAILSISKNTVKNQLVKAKYIIRREME
ncbi:MAG TPA: sigma-70 family RNA polymerase sigma factor [Cyclobacteriaceae bacterium]|nr:sigma-70 family RNA polymerase sigma factor [Cyclobacteriaceae bacterium]